MACIGGQGPVDYGAQEASGHLGGLLTTGQTRSDVAPVVDDEARMRAGRLGLEPGITVQEINYDTDVDEGLRLAVEEIIGGETVDEDYDDVVDVVLMWWREEDGDLADGLLDAIGPLADHGVVWLLTPKPGVEGHIEAEDISVSRVFSGGLKIGAGETENDV